MSICANCEKATVYLDKNTFGEPYHYVKCDMGHWSRRMTVFNETLRFERSCAEYVSMGDELLNDYLGSLPKDRVEYENKWQR